MRHLFIFYDDDDYVEDQDQDQDQVEDHDQDQDQDQDPDPDQDGVKSDSRKVVSMRPRLGYKFRGVKFKYGNLTTLA